LTTTPGSIVPKRFQSATTLAVLIVLLGLGLRVHAAWEANAALPDSPARLTADEPGYDNLARSLITGEGFTWPGRVPLYPVWLAGLHLLTGYSYAQAIYIQCLVGALAVWLTFVLGRDRFGSAAGLLAALGVAIDIVLVRQSARFLSEILFTPLVLLIAIALGRAMDTNEMRRFAWTGVWIGIANLVRPTLVLFPVWMALAVLVTWRDRAAVRGAIALVVTSTLVVLPWVARNYVREGAIYPLATSNAILWQGSPEYYHLVRDQGYTYLDVWNKVIYGPGGEGHDPGSVAGDRYWTARAMKSIASEPLVYARFCLEKAVTYWIGDPNANWGDTWVFNHQVFREWGFSRVETAQMMAARAFPLLVVPALLMLGGQRRSIAAVLHLLAYCTLLHALTHAEARLSEPLHPLLFVIVGGAITVASARWRRGGGSGLPSVEVR
jgi:4-amino-4-deoxy-L-arabinose transferase-like glycosyltransferase